MAADEVKPTQVTTPAQQKAEAKDRAEAIRQGIDGQAEVYRVIHTAVVRRDWKVLGYGTLAEYFEGERIAERWRAAEKPLRALVAMLRTEAELSQARTAEALGISQQRVSQLERGSGGNEARQQPRNLTSHNGEALADQAERGEVTSKTEPAAPIAPAQKTEIAPKPARPVIMLEVLEAPGKTGHVPYPELKSPATFNETTGPGISWAAWSWNPVTGCLHGCEYCYAREITNRRPALCPAGEDGFTPTFHHERLAAPANTKIPRAHEGDPAWKRVFVVSTERPVRAVGA